MYFKKIEIENTGPIENLIIDFPKNESGAPKPLIIVGENGAGKTILISHLVNALISAKQQVFDDTEVEHGKVYKYRSSNYIKTGKNYSYAHIAFEDGTHIEEWQLDTIKSEFEAAFSPLTEKASWSSIPPNEYSHFRSTFNKTNAKEIFENRCCLYFPVNRYEEPAWLNINNLKERATYTELKHISRQSNRKFISKTPLKENRNWILDLILDRQALEINFHTIHISSEGTSQGLGFDGQSSRIYEAIHQLLRKILRTDGEIRLGIGDRRNRQIGIMKDGNSWIPNIFQLSTGETLLLNLFLTTIRDYDLSGGTLDTLSDIKGIVIIDEIDAHLHTRHQKEILPDLIASFPNVQFIITTHSPLFLLGMEEKLGPNAFKIVNMPLGETVAASDFSELTAAYDSFRQTNLHRQEIAEALKANSRPIVFVEGDYDVRYITRAAELLNKNHIIEAIQLKDGSGFGNLDKIWRLHEVQLAELLPSKILLLYDCDTNKPSEQRGNLLKRVIPSMPSEINSGIENLFPVSLISQLEETHPQFIDFTAATPIRIRNQTEVKAAKKSVNKDEKGNMCNWICGNGTKEQFDNFSIIFDIIESTLLNGDS